MPPCCFDQLVGYDPADEYTAAFLIAAIKGSYADHLDADGLKGARIGILREGFGSDEAPESAAVNAVVRSAVAAIEGCGATAVDIGLPGLMDHIIETSLYLTHSRHDINAFLAARPRIPYGSLEAIKRDGKYHPVLDLLEEVFKGPEKPRTIRTIIASSPRAINSSA